MSTAQNSIEIIEELSAEKLMELLSIILTKIGYVDIQVSGNKLIGN